MGIPPGPISELFYMGVAQQHPASPALLPAPLPAAPPHPRVFSSAVAVWIPGAVLELGCKHRSWPYSRAK